MPYRHLSQKTALYYLVLHSYMKLGDERIILVNGQIFKAILGSWFEGGRCVL